MKPIFLMLFLLALTQSVLAQAYTITDLGILPGGTYSDAAAVNNLGHVTGTADALIDTSIKNYIQRGNEAFFWHDGEMKDIGAHNLLPTAGVAINDSDEIAGASMDTCGATVGLWLKRKTSPQVAGYGCGYAINNKGQSAGEEHDFYDPGRHPFAVGQQLEGKMPIANPLGLVATENAEAAGINDAGLVVGSADLSAKPGTQPHHAVLWNKGKRQDLGTLGGTESRAVAVNAGGQIVGTSSLRLTSGPDPVLYHAVLWDNGKIHDLGTLPGDKQSNANAINTRGDIVGASGDRGCLWRGGKTVDLNTLLPAGSGWVLQGASGINDRGQIVGSGLHHGKRRGYLLTPK